MPQIIGAAKGMQCASRAKRACVSVFTCSCMRRLVYLHVCARDFMTCPRKEHAAKSGIYRCRFHRETILCIHHAADTLRTRRFYLSLLLESHTPALWAGRSCAVHTSYRTSLQFVSKKIKLKTPEISRDFRRKGRQCCLPTPTFIHPWLMLLVFTFHKFSF